jgi:hypothetical protein
MARMEKGPLMAFLSVEYCRLMVGAPLPVMVIVQGTDVPPTPMTL